MSDFWLQTYSGIAFDLLEPTPEMVVALQCRFAGHTREPYSIAQHSVLVSTALPGSLAFCMTRRRRTSLTFKGLMRHSTLSRTSSYDMIEEHIQRAIFQRYDTMWPSRSEWAEIKKADLTVLAAELRDLKKIPPKAWDDLNGIVPLPDRINVWSWQEAERMFLDELVHLQENRRQAAAQGEPGFKAWARETLKGRGVDLPKEVRR